MFRKGGYSKLIRNELKEYIENNIFPKYSLNESAHGIEHIKDVIEKSLKFANSEKDVNDEMAYVVAAYHDIGHHIDAKNHEKVSAEIFINDKNLRKYFDENQMKIMKEAIEDHRASSDHEPRNIYGKIVSSADRNTDVDTSIKRSLTYNKEHSPELTEDELIETVRQHLISKFGKKRICC